MNDLQSSRQGTLLIIGGHEDKKGERLILKELAQRAQGGTLLVATVASRTQVDQLWQIYKEQFTELGVHSVAHLAVGTRAYADRQENIELVDRASAIFFTGGDQKKIIDDLRGTALHQRMRRFYFEEGGVIAGTSAGAAAIPATMLVAGRSEESHRIGDRLAIGEGLGFLGGALVDQHFAERGRMGRLLAAVALDRECLGIGIDENTAILLEDAGEFRVLGAGAVYVLDGADISYSNVEGDECGSALSVCNVRLHSLSDGYRFKLRERQPVTPGGVEK